jgi:hypothetical protein
MISVHHAFIPPSDTSVPLWRYMDLSKFIAILQQRKLYFAGVDTLGDPFEGSLPRLTADLAQYTLSNRLTDPRLSNFKDWPESRIADHFRQISDQRRALRENVYVNCWHMNDHESAAMWSLYSKSSDAVCIQTTFAELSSVLPSTVFVGKVEYIDYDSAEIPISNLFHPYLRKRQSYEHEREVRAVVYSKMIERFTADDPRGAISDGGVKIPVDLNLFINVVFVSPTSPGWYRTLVEDVARKYGLAATVMKSNLLATPLF